MRTLPPPPPSPPPPRGYRYLIPPGGLQSRRNDDVTPYDNNDRRVPKKEKETAAELRWSRSLPLVGQKPPLWCRQVVGRAGSAVLQVSDPSGMLFCSYRGDLRFDFALPVNRHSEGCRCWARRCTPATHRAWLHCSECGKECLRLATSPIIVS